MRYILLLVSLLSIPLSAANRVWDVGKVLDSSRAKSYAQTSATINATSTTVGPVTDTNGRVNVQTTTITNTQLLIAGTEYNYLINDSRAQDMNTGVALVRTALAATTYSCLDTSTRPLNGAAMFRSRLDDKSDVTDTTSFSSIRS